ncbi:MAG: class I SAM-dependent rRNA methyltransferase [Candidatus Rifleibacteriota bacterium]
MKKTLKLYLKKNKESAIAAGHPWIYREALASLPKELQTADIVKVYSDKNKYVGCGYIDLDSKITVRLLPIDPDQNIEHGIAQLIKQALNLRTQFFADTETNAFRLINGEGDFLPGLIADKYGDAISMQIYSSGLIPLMPVIAQTLADNIPQIKWIWQRNEIRLARQECSKLIKGKKLPQKIIFIENGLKFYTDLVNGQKTGFFLDQRDNRDLIRKLANHRTFLNICGYTGAFTVAAAAGNAKNTVTVDIARPALNEAQKNLELNGFSENINELVCADMYEYLQNQNEKYDLVVLDPPSMARNRKDSRKAQRAYRRLNTLGMKRVKKGGFLFTASCTSQVNRNEFFEAVKEAAVKSKKRFQVIKEAYHAPDHPFSLVHSEGRYLKGMLLRINN